MRCPLSPLICVLIIEPMALKIWSHQNIRGIKYHKETYMALLFVDDVAICTLDLASTLQTVEYLFLDVQVYF